MAAGRPTAALRGLAAPYDTSVRLRRAPLSAARALAQLQDGDVIRVDAETRRLDLVGVSEEELGARLASFQPPPYKATAGTLYKYIKSVSSASLGCVTDM